MKNPPSSNSRGYKATRRLGKWIKEGGIGDVLIHPPVMSANIMDFARKHQRGVTWLKNIFVSSDFFRVLG